MWRVCGDQNTAVSDGDDGDQHRIGRRRAARINYTATGLRRAGDSMKGDASLRTAARSAPHVHRAIASRYRPREQASARRLGDARQPVLSGARLASLLRAAAS
jgi:hypothetical protein